MVNYVIDSFLSGEFLRLPGVGTAPAVGVISSTMAVALHTLGFHYDENVVTATFAVSGTCGLLITGIINKLNFMPMNFQKL